MEKVHVDQRGVCQLDKENLVAGNSTDRIRIDLATERVKTVKDQSDMTMIGASDTSQASR